MIIERLKKPNTKPTGKYDIELMDALERFSFNTNLYTKTTTSVPNKLVYVESVDDLPAPINGIIYPEDLTQYCLLNDVIIPYSIDSTDKTVQFTSLTNSNWIYVGGGTFFIGQPFYLDFIRCNFIGLDVGYGSGTLLDISRPGFIGLEFFLMRLSRALGFDSLGKIQNFQVAVNITAFLNLGDGIELENVFFFTFDNIIFSNNKNTVGSIFLSAKGTTSVGLINSAIAAPLSIETLFLCDQTLTAIGRVNNVGFLSLGGAYFTPTSLRQDDIRWTYVNSTIRDSTVEGRFKIKENALSTTITTIDTPTKINTIWTDGVIEERMSFQISCTFNGTTDIITSTITHGMSTNDVVYFRVENAGTLPTGLFEDVPYFVTNPTATTFQVSSIPGGSAIDFTGNGTADQYFRSTTGYNDGTIVYVGLEGATILVSGWIAIKGATGAHQDVRGVIMKRSASGVLTRQSDCSVVSPTSSRSISSSVNDILTLNRHEGVEIYVENIENTSNMTITDLIVSITKI